MSIQVGKYKFEGPFTSTESLQDSPGVYLVLCYGGEKYHPIDVGESKTVKSRVEDHDRKPCWSRNCNSTLVVAVLYTPYLDQAGRRSSSKSETCTTSPAGNGRKRRSAFDRGAEGKS